MQQKFICVQKVNWFIFHNINVYFSVLDRMKEIGH